MIMQEFALKMSQAFVKQDYKLANELLEELMDRQDLRSTPDDPKRGTFRFYAKDTEVTDRNALTFCGCHLAFVAMEHAEHVDQSLKQRFWEVTLPECLVGYDGHFRASGSGYPGEPRPRWWQCNVWFLNIAGRLMVARALNRQDHIEIARDHLKQACRNVRLYNIGEYNSPTYIGDQLHGLHWAWYYAVDEEFRSNVSSLLDQVYLDMAEHYHADSGELAGTWSRYYENDIAGRRHFGPYAKAAFCGSEPSYLERFGLEDYRCPEFIRKIGVTQEPYSVHRRSQDNIRRTMYQTAEFSLATQSERFVWYTTDTALVLTYAAPQIKRRVGVIANPYWSTDVHAATDYAAGFDRWAHQHENRAILSCGHRQGGNDLLFNLADLDQYEPKMADGKGHPIIAPSCPMMPAVPDQQPGREANPHRPGRSADLTSADPATREPPGSIVEGAVLVELPSCYVAVIPEEDMILRVAAMRHELSVVIPVRPRALFAVVVLGKSECGSLEEFAGHIGKVALEEIATPNTACAARLSGLGPVLTAARDREGRLCDRRVDDLPLPYEEYLCYSPFYERRSGEGLDIPDKAI